MKKYLILVFSICYFTFLVYCQEVDSVQNQLTSDVQFNVGETYKGQYEYYPNYFRIKDNEFLSISRDNNSLVFKKYLGDNPDLKFSKTVPLEKNKFLGFNNIIKIKNKLFLFYYNEDKSTKKCNLYAQEIDLNEGGFINERKQLFQTDKKLSKLSDKYKESEFDFTISRDSTKLLIRYLLSDSESKENKKCNTYGILVFDNEMNPIWEDKIILPHIESQINILDFSIDQYGDVLFLMRLFNEINPNERNFYKENNHTLCIIKYSKKNIAGALFKCNSKGLFFGEARLVESSNGITYFAGYYGEFGKDIIKGTFVGSVKNESDFKDISLLPFNEDIALNLDPSDSYAPKGAQGRIGGVTLNQLTILDDGSLLIIGEKYFIYRYIKYTESNSNVLTTATINNSGKKVRTVESNEEISYYYDDIFITKISPETGENWMNRIPKSFTKYLNNSNKTKVVFYKEHVVFVFNDNLTRERPFEGVKTFGQNNDKVAQSINIVALKNGNLNRFDFFNKYYSRSYNLILYNQNSFCYEQSIGEKELRMIKASFNFPIK